MDKRNVMNLLLAGGVALPVGALAVPYALFFVPARYTYLEIAENLLLDLNRRRSLDHAAPVVALVESQPRMP